MERGDTYYCRMREAFGFMWHPDGREAPSPTPEELMQREYPDQQKTAFPDGTLQSRIRQHIENTRRAK